MIKLFCVIVGAQGSAFPVNIDASHYVGDLKRKIKDDNEGDPTLKNVAAKNLQLFQAKTENGDGWLSSDVGAVIAMRTGAIPEQVKKLLIDEIDPAEQIGDTFRNAPTKKTIHVLVVVPGILTTIEVNESQDKDRKDELEYYQRIGQEIQNNCREHCEPILDKINQIYNEGPNPKPFICVEGSSGMGKSQLAFALGGEGTHGRPWFYWPLGSASDFDQRIYKNFSSIAKAFEAMVRKDKLDDREEEDAFLACDSPVYTTEELWTYGFIIELLRHCSRTNVGAHMVRVAKQTFNVAKSTQDDVIEVRSRMEKNGEVLPFFILDEMTPAEKNRQMKRKAAFQRNVFRACGLVVIVMGTDSKISNLVSQSDKSRSDVHWWMTVVPSFPPYLAIPFEDPAKQDAWQKVLKLHPVVKHIAEHSRGLFSRYFMGAVVQFASKKGLDNETFALADLLDAAFEAVYLEVQNRKAIMKSVEGRCAQLMALSYTNADSEGVDIDLRADNGDGTSELPPDACITVPVGGRDSSVGRSSRKRRAADGDITGEPARKRSNVGVKNMHVHFANLVDGSMTDVSVSKRGLAIRNSNIAWEPVCRFPAIKEDVLLYLAVLGGKNFSAYSDGEYEYPIVRVFKEYHKRSGSDTHGNINAPRNDFSKFENMVAHALFCASRRNGVRGIGFNEFFSGLVGKFKIQTKASDQTENFEVNGLLEGYDGLMKKFTDTKIPFLAPPNAIWPDYILRACGNGDGDCNFGHLVRAKDKDRLDCYVMVPGNDNPLFVCECKHWKKKLDSGAMKGIIEGLNDEYTGRPGPDGQRKRKWNNWDLALVFCDELTHFRQKQMDAWEFPGTGIVTVDCQTWVVNWIIKPEAGEKLVIVLQTGHLFPNGVDGGMEY